MLKTEKQIFDNVHGYIGVTAAELEVIDTPAFQRLRQIKQLGLAHLVWPGATHTRFIHSLGAMFMMDQFLGNAVKREISDEERQKYRLAALLHDIGHYPLSHTLEHVIIKKRWGKSHEGFGAEVIRKFLSEKLENYSVTEITNTIEGKSKDGLNLLLKSALDADKSDYLLRDSFNTGVSYGKVNVPSLLRIITSEKDRIVFEKDEVPIESFLIGRYYLYRGVVHHKTVVAINLMIQRIYELLVEEGYVTAPKGLLSGDGSEFLSYTDDMLSMAMHSYLRRGKSAFTKELISMLMNRVPLKIAYSSTEAVEDGAPRENLFVRSLEESKTELEKFANSAGVDPDWIFPITLRDLGLIDEETTIFIRRKGEMIPLIASNALVLRMIGSKTLFDARIYAKPESASKLRKAMNKEAK